MAQARFGKQTLRATLPSSFRHSRNFVVTPPALGLHTASPVQVIVQSCSPMNDAHTAPGASAAHSASVAHGTFFFAGFAGGSVGAGFGSHTLTEIDPTP